MSQQNFGWLLGLVSHWVGKIKVKMNIYIYIYIYICGFKYK